MKACGVEMIYRKYGIYHTTISSDALERKKKVDELTEHFISRGVNEYTARDWAEQETPRKFTQVSK
jgi:hypothetical protein